MKEWKKPELIVLVRHQPEEAVLSNCKTNDGGGPNAAIVGTCTLGYVGCPSNLPS